MRSYKFSKEDERPTEDKKSENERLMKEFLKKGGAIGMDSFILADAFLKGIRDLGYKDSAYALNEISVVRKDTTSMVNINTSLNGIHLNSYFLRWV